MTEPVPARLRRDLGHELFLGQVYTDEQWDRQKSWNRYLPDFPNLCRALLWYWPMLLAISPVGIFVCVYNRFGQSHGAPDITTGDYTGPFRILSFAISLMLQFECQACYGRWVEAQVTYGALLHIVRNSVLQERVEVGSACSSPLQQDLFSGWAGMLPFTLCAAVSRDRDVKRGCEGLLPSDQLASLQDASSATMINAEMLHSLIQASGGRDSSGVWAGRRLGEINRFHRAAAVCQTLYEQPIPPAFTRQNGRFVITWIFFLPFAIFSSWWWFTPVVSLVVGFLLSAVEAIGIQMEQPFAVYPKAALSSLIKRNVMELRESGQLAKTFVNKRVAQLDCKDT